MIIYADNGVEGRIARMLVKNDYFYGFAYFIYKDNYYVSLPL